MMSSARDKECSLQSKTQDNYSSMGEKDKPISYNAMSAVIEAGLEGSPCEIRGDVVRDDFLDKPALGRDS